MTYRRSRIVRRQDVEEGARLGVLRARAIDRARVILERADDSAEQAREKRRLEGAYDTEVEAGRRLLSALMQRDMTLKSSAATVEHILSEATQRVIGRSELDADALIALEERLDDLRRRDPAELTYPKGDQLTDQPWFESQVGEKWRLAFNDLDLDLGEAFSQADFNEAAKGFQTGLPRLADVVRTARPVRLRGAVHELTGLGLQASVTGVRIGEICEVSDPDSGRVITCEVVGFRGNLVMLMPLGEASGIGPDSEVVPTGRPLEVRAGWGLLGRVLDGLGASGIRSRRWVTELPSIMVNSLDIHVCDLVLESLNWVEKNSEKFHPERPLTLIPGDLRSRVLEGGWHWIDLDPYGSPMQFLDPVIQALSRDAILEVSATDTAALTGSSKGPTMRRYGAFVRTDDWAHDSGLRVLLAKSSWLRSAAPNAQSPSPDAVRQKRS